MFLLQRHISITHDGFSLLKCPECSKAFGKKKNLNKHINSVHSINNNLAEVSQDIISALEAVKDFNDACRTKVLKANWKQTIIEF